jgi:hypothetical protein
MRKLSFSENHKFFDAWIQVYDKLLLEVTHKLRFGGFPKKLRRTLKAEFVEALALRCATRWEQLCEKDILASLNRNSSQYQKALGLRLRKHLTRDECHAIVIGHRYLDFKSVGDVKDFGKKYLVDRWNPFKGISSRHAKRIDEFLAIRNYITHYSSAATRAYRRILTNEFKYRRVIDAGHFLMALVRSSKQHRWGQFLDALLAASDEMRAAVS